MTLLSLFWNYISLSVDYRQLVSGLLLLPFQSSAWLSLIQASESHLSCI